MRDLLRWERRGEFSLILSLQVRASNEPQVPVPAQCGVCFPQVSLPSTPMTGEEDWEDYREGGYHPVNIGDEFANGRYVVVRKLGWSVSPIPFALFGPFLTFLQGSLLHCLARKGHSVSHPSIPTHPPHSQSRQKIQTCSPQNRQICRSLHRDCH